MSEIIDWGQVLQGDRFFALLQIRALTYGPEYAFAVNCGSDGCRARIEWELDLRRLPCRPLSEESLAAFHPLAVPLAVPLGSQGDPLTVTGRNGEGASTLFPRPPAFAARPRVR